MIKVFIDGREGTTGLQIAERLRARDDLSFIEIDENLRKDVGARKACINQSDVAVLCLPDAAAIEAVSLVENPETIVIDASTAHRTAEGWAYGFPELSDAHRGGIARGKRIAVPGCHASGFIAIVYPLIACGLLPRDYPLTCTSLTGYSGGGKKMIAQYRDTGRSALLDAPRQYALAQRHKHLKEMQAITGIAYPPVFSPIVADYYCGMQVTVPLLPRLLGGAKAADVHAALARHYEGQKMVRVLPLGAEATMENNMLPSNAMAGRNDMLLYVGGSDDCLIACAIYDNLGKGASGAAVQCMNIALGIEENLGL